MTAPVKIYFSSDELATAKAMAAAVGMPLSRFIKSCVEGREVEPIRAVPEVNRATYTALARAAANLNQIAAAANGGGMGAVDPVKFKAQVAELIEQMRRAQAEVLGMRE